MAEVVSTHDRAGDLQQKVRDWLTAGVRMVWVAYPSTREVPVFRAEGTVEIFASDGEISGEDVLPGFSRPVADLFPG